MSSLGQPSCDSDCIEKVLQDIRPHVGLLSLACTPKAPEKVQPFPMKESQAAFLGI